MNTADKYFVAVPADRVQMLIDADKEKRTETCILCGDKQHAEDMSLINEQGTKACPRCIFLIALYHKEGINKKLSMGCLMLEKLNAKFRKIIQEEFNPHPKETYRKYLGEMIDEEENRLGIVRLTEEQFSAVAEKDFPFVFLDIAEAEKLELKQGRELTLQVGDNGSKRIARKIYSFTKFSARTARKYGHKKSAVICYVPEEF